MGYHLVIGLGNPGDEYVLTRHNVGRIVVDALASRECLRWTLDAKRCARIAKCVLGGKKVILAKATTFMNESGIAALRLCNYYWIPPERTVVIYDDIAFAVGDFRINEREGTGGHNGVADILSRIGGGFTRYRIGIGPKANRLMDLKDHVLGKFSDGDLEILAEKMPEILQCLQLLLDKGVEYAMNLANRRKLP
jgi:PTH1 family peptidyl-tRNA hydrolase